MLHNSAKRFWDDESGFVMSSDLILVSTILVIGLLVGLTSVRDQIVQELGDLSMAVGNLNQSYSFAGHSVTFAGSTFTVAGSSFEDLSDFGEDGTNEDNTDTANSEPAGISVQETASSET